MECGRGIYWLQSTARLDNRGESAMARVRIHAGQTLRFSLTTPKKRPPFCYHWTIPFRNGSQIARDGGNSGQNKQNMMAHTARQ
jgi:hypothetical protein